ncbi:endonuclease domain-containing protein [Mangrovimonas sp. ST2L15]|uniref:endonuclease domain-containing protein n=1 Tax=Mangrovimonas sp. ST2L15 TaxID=1645916 RepID=UPI0006B53AEA|nr:endonuclease domain-containing protein [Mangrovimonas sp. ST2L15]
MPNKQNIHNRLNLKEKRQDLRNHLTPAEAFLWTHLKSKKLKGRKFNRQHSIGNYIVDFYCASEKLIIELDGEVHNNPIAEEYDKHRTEYLNQLGYQVLRFENKMVFDYLDSVLKEIKDSFKDV